LATPPFWLAIASVVVIEAIMPDRAPQIAQAPV
jgi:uncharacterized protein YjeT (DUF2065 family)